MTYALTTVLAVLLITVLVYLRRANRNQVAALFRSSIRELQSAGMETEQALRQATGRFLRRPPFNLIQADELSCFVHVLQDLGSPVDVGAELLQQCENRGSVLELKDVRKLSRLAYATDLRLGIQQLLRNAKILHGKAKDRYPNIMVALLAALGARNGWAFVEEQGDALIFEYRQERVHMPRQGSGRDAARLILFNEMMRRPMVARPDTDQARKAARQELIDGFDALFDEIFIGLGKPGKVPDSA